MRHLRRNSQMNFLNEDSRIGNYLWELLMKYDKKASNVSFEAHLHESYVGNIINGKKNNLLCNGNDSGGITVSAQIWRAFTVICPKKEGCDHLVRYDET